MGQHRHIRSKVVYLARDEIFRSQKPYLVHPTVDISDIADAKETNRIIEEHETEVRDVRCGYAFGLDLTGWTFVKADTGMSTTDFDDKHTVETAYYNELERVVKENFPQYTKIAFLDHMVRKRSPHFPLGVGVPTEAEQPLSLAHSDFSLQGALRRVDMYRKADPDLAGRAFDMLNVWRLIKRGPNNDWPLGLCDYRTVDAEDDTIDNDVVFYEGTTENTLLHFSPNHRWYWMSDMDMDDLIVLRNVSFEGRDAPRAFHAAFEVPQTESALGSLRQSIEVRMVAFL